MLRHMRRLAAQGDPEGLNSLGIYCREKGQHEQAASYFSRAAASGHGEAIGLLGLCYLHGEGIEQNTTRAVELFHESAERGSAVGHLYLGICYMEGNGMPQDAEKAIHHLEIAADLDDEDAQYWLGMCYLQGIGTTINREHAIALLRKAAYNLQNDAAAQLDEMGIGYKTIVDDELTPQEDDTSDSAPPSEKTPQHAFPEKR